MLEESNNHQISGPFGLSYNGAALRNTALRIQAALPQPRAGECLTISDVESKPSLLQPSLNPVILTYPEAFFALCPQLSQSEMPQEWIEMDLHWVRKAGWGQTFEKLYKETMTTPQENRESCNHVVPEFSAAAGLIFYALSLPPSNTFREALLRRACLSPMGAYFAAEGLTLPDERGAIFESVRRSSRLLFWTSRIPGFQELCLSEASKVADLYGGLTLILSDKFRDAAITWCDRLVYLSFQHPEAAGASLILFPQAPSSLRDRWFYTLRNAGAAEMAYMVGRFGLPAHTSAELQAGLRTLATADRDRFWCHWYRDVEPEEAQKALDAHLDANLLWSAELLHARNLSDVGLHDKMRYQSAGKYFSNPAALILRFLEARRSQEAGE